MTVTSLLLKEDRQSSVWHLWGVVFHKNTSRRNQLLQYILKPLYMNSWMYREEDQIFLTRYQKLFSFPSPWVHCTISPKNTFFITWTHQMDWYNFSQEFQLVTVRPTLLMISLQWSRGEQKEMQHCSNQLLLLVYLLCWKEYTKVSFYT